jgi:hypothetical protein
MLDNILPPRQMAADVSSQDDSMARMVQVSGWLIDNRKILYQWLAKVGFLTVYKIFRLAIAECYAKEGGNLKLPGVIKAAGVDILL